jgi:uncharacterized membrane protein
MDERRIHQIFLASVVLKGMDAAIEVVSGIALIFASHQAIVGIVHWITQNELAEDPHDFVANSLAGFSIRRVEVKRVRASPHLLTLRSFAGLASLRDRHFGPPMMGSEE